jgi:MTH538 TIR-like domain (DUF1863)
MRRVFISFVIEDENAIKGLRLLAKNPGYGDLEFYDESVRVPIDSVQAPYIRSRIKDKISRCGVVLCVISRDTHKSSWVSWELETAIRMAKPIVAMAIKGLTESVTMPHPLQNTSVPFYVWNPESLNSYLANAKAVG